MHGLPEATLKAMRRNTWKPKLVDEPRGFYDGNASTVEAAYIDAWLACLYVADKYGDATLRKLFDAAAARPASDSLAQVDAAALQSELHTTQPAFTAAVRSYGIKLLAKVH